MELDAVKSRGFGVLSRLAELLDHKWDLTQLKRAWRDHLLFSRFSKNVAVRCDRRRCNRKRPSVEIWMRYASHMPKLEKDFSTGLMDGIGHLAPPGDLF